jgi:hypothetical protein
MSLALRKHFQKNLNQQKQNINKMLQDQTFLKKLKQLEIDRTYS